jgi:hypothetical protein
MASRDVDERLRDAAREVEETRSPVCSVSPRTSYPGTLIMASRTEQ